MKGDFSNSLKREALDLGADVVGIAGLDGFKHAPEGHKPSDVLRDR